MQPRTSIQLFMCCLLTMSLSLTACDSENTSSPGSEPPSSNTTSNTTAEADISDDAGVGDQDGDLVSSDGGTSQPEDTSPEPDSNPDPGPGPDTSPEPDVPAEVSCQQTCDDLTTCLIDTCDGFGAGAREILNQRCLEVCSPEFAAALEANTCEDNVSLVSERFSMVAEACVSPEPPEPGEGTKALYIGHSFGRVFAERMTAWTREVGIMNHTQEIVFSGGQSGSPQSLLENAEKRADIEAILDGGDVDILIMICCSLSFIENVGGADPAIQTWMDYALEQNPNTRFVLAMPWIDYPTEYDNAAAFSETWYNGFGAWQALIRQLREDNPGVTITSLPHGRAAIELRNLYEAGDLSDVVTMSSNTEASIFTDYKGHADEILKDLGSLVWLGALYDVDLTGFRLVQGYDTDLVEIAETILSEDELLR